MSRCPEGLVEGTIIDAVEGDAVAATAKQWDLFICHSQDLASHTVMSDGVAVFSTVTLVT